MIATLYQPGYQPTTVSAEGFSFPITTNFAHVPPQAATLLGCSSAQIDVLACSPNYVVYTIFDIEEAANPIATQAVADLMNIDFDINNEDILLHGPVLIIS